MWIELARKGQVIVSPWKTERGFPIHRYAGSEDDFVAGLQDPEIQSEARWVHANLDKRSRLDHHIATMRAKMGEEQRQELRLLEAKYHRAYDQAAAWQHECGAFESSVTNLIEMTQIGFATDRPVIETTDPGVVLDLTLRFDDIDPLFLHKLGTMENGDFRRFFWKHSLLLNNWWSHSDIEALRQAVDRLVEDIVVATVPEVPQDPHAGRVPDVIRVFVETALEFLTPLKPIYRLLSGLNDVTVRYFSSKRHVTKERLVQRIIDIAKERIEDERHPGDDQGS
jgi:hypothetical protein